MSKFFEEVDAANYGYGMKLRLNYAQAKKLMLSKCRLGTVRTTSLALAVPLTIALVISSYAVLLMLLAWAGSIALLLSYAHCRKRSKYNIFQVPPRSCLYFGGGGGLVTYQMGVAHGIYTAFGTEPFRDLHFEGMSAGAFIAGYSLATVHAIHDMVYWYYCHVRKAHEHAHRSPIGMFLTLSRCIRGLGFDYFGECERAAGIPNSIGSRPPLNCNHAEKVKESLDWLTEKYAVYGTELSLRFRTVSLAGCQTCEEFAQSMEATSLIPVFVGFFFTNVSKALLGYSGGSARPSVQEIEKLSDRRLTGKVIDGAFGTFVNNFEQLHPERNRTVSFTFLEDGFPSTTKVQMGQWSRVDMTKFIVTGDLEQADRLFWGGFDDLLDNIDEVQTALEDGLGVKLTRRTPELLDTDLQRKQQFLSSELLGSEVDFRMRMDLFPM